MKKSILLIATILSGSPLLLLAEKPHVWETGRVIAQEMGSQASGAYAGAALGGIIAVPLQQRWNAVTVEVGPYIYQWYEVGSRAIILPVNDTIMFYRDGPWFIVLDIKNRKHKFAMQGMTRKLE